MIFTKLIYFVLSLNSTKNTYYKIIYKKEIKGCVEGNVTEKFANKFNAVPGKALKFANKFNALPGTCQDYNCTLFKGIYKIPYCCTIYGYEC